MAEQRPYRVPGFSADARLSHAKRLALLSLAGAFIAINWVTTQHAAQRAASCVVAGARRFSS